MRKRLPLPSLLSTSIRPPWASTAQRAIAKDYLHRLKEQFGGDFVALLTLYDAKSGMPDPLAALLADPTFKDSIESMAKQVVNV